MRSARSSGSSPSRSSRIWWYFSVRRPVSDHTIRSSPRSLSARAVRSTVCWSKSTTGSRLLVWLQAVRSAFAVRGYDAGTVVCFSNRLPRMR